MVKPLDGGASKPTARRMALRSIPRNHRSLPHVCYTVAPRDAGRLHLLCDGIIDTDRENQASRIASIEDTEC